MAESLGRRVVLSRRAVVAGAQGALEGASPAVCERGWQIHHHLYTTSLVKPVSLPRRTIGQLRLRDVGAGLRDIRVGVACVSQRSQAPPGAARLVESDLPRHQ